MSGALLLLEKAPAFQGHSFHHAGGRVREMAAVKPAGIVAGGERCIRRVEDVFGPCWKFRRG